ncbi:fructose-bisphosphate aldolase class II/tagatose 1,6-diphosphate aldolase GatY/KbaY [Scopulibacillus darangshiensis]|uniref:Fructose-bisphosphate aldolase class II/tagatose 1,6-diphosphate aldolase GatY/KbaY n=1 Tax=Scopulibacillus darangshiensis TaxID=442528 RepID=A0A4R2NM74_9BACL|nr:class II fructose-bisphosphate aldolase [Scopulibacillus darangshiensis]TCP22334.1 fructose-bisphosphate aldolase class II/tagatose 1,6-diphosphate aldolase GatY/KbaY [Scopulibacillus darangshiensis]
MGLVTTKEILRDAYQNHYAVGAFGAHNLEIIKAVIAGGEELGAPVILQTTPGTIKYVGINYMKAMAEAAAEVAKVPVALHLDHGDSYDTVIKCLRAGYTSVMIDGSTLPFAENINLVKKVVEAAHSAGVPVEAELGTIGGVEDDLVIEDVKALLTDPDAAEQFVKETNIDSFAPAFGTAHGMYKEEPKLAFDLLDDIYNRTDCPLVMHGASGVAAGSVQRALDFGVTKVNFSTELKDVFAEEIRRFFHEHPEQNDPRKVFVPARNRVTNLVKAKIDMLQGTCKV